MKKQKALSCIALSLTGLALAFGTLTFTKTYKPAAVTFATYTNGDAATYYNTIDESQSGNTLLTALRTLNLSKRQSTVGYSSMGTTPSGQFKYTDYDTSTVQYDSNNQPYGTKISSFYTYTSATSWNREHVWPNSHGGGSGGDAGTPYPDADIHMPRPTISSENSSRGNSFFVEGMNNSSSGWDPYTAGYSAESRGEAARITFYCTLVNSKLILAPNNTTPSGTDSVTGQSYGSGHTMGNLETLIKWNINYPVTQREKNRNEGAEYLQGNRNAFVDHPEYACKIWGNVNSTIKNMCANASWDVGPSVSISRSTASIVVDDTTMINATSSDGSNITWSTSDNTVVTISSASSSSGTNITLTGVGPGTATITARATISGTVYSATCTVTVSSSGSGGESTDPDADSYTILNTDAPGTYPTTATEYTADSGLKFYAYNVMNQSSKIQFKKSGGYLYNSTSLNLGTLTISGASGTLTVYAGTTRNPSSTTISGSNGVYDLTGYNYFKIINSSSSVATCSSITVGLAEETKTLSSISVSTAPTKTTYTAGEYFDPTGLVITRTYSDSTSDTYTYANHASDFTFSPTTSTALTTSNVSVTITYGGKSCSQSITVNAAKTLSSISVSTAPTKTTYTAGEYFDPTGLVVRRTYSDSTYDTYTYSGHTSEFAFSPSTSTALTTSNVSVTISYGGKTCSQSITVNAAAKTLTSISVSGGKTSFVLDDTFTFGGTVTANFSDSTSSDVTPSATFSGYNMSVAGNYTVTVSYTYGGTTKTATYGITVSGSGGGSGTEQASQRVVSKSSSTYFETGSIYFTTGGESSRSAVCDAFTMTQTKVSGSTAVPNTYDQIRVYTNHNLMFIPNEGYEITTVVITAGSTSYANGIGGTSFTNCEKSVSGSVATLTPFDGTTTFGFQNSTQTQLNYIVVNYEYESSSVPEVTSISATVSKTYYVGESISSSDITVEDNLGHSITEFTFASDGYQFTYADAASGGALTSKTFTNAVSGSNLTCSLTVQVQRKARQDSMSATDSVTYTDLPTSYQTSTSERTAASGIKFIAYNLANYSSKMQFRASGGYFQTTESMQLTSLTINNRETNALTVYGSTNGTTFSQTITGTNDVYDLTGYNYVKVMKNGTGAAYCASLTIEYGGGDSAINLANYIMYEDTTNQCVSKLPTAIGYLAGLSSTERTTFSSSNDYVISTARTRLEAWASSQGKSVNYSTGELANKANVLTVVNKKQTNNVIIVVLCTALGAGLVTTYGFLRRKKSEE